MQSLRRQEHILSLVDVKANDNVEYEFCNDVARRQVTTSLDQKRMTLKIASLMGARSCQQFRD